MAKQARGPFPSVAAVAVPYGACPRPSVGLGAALPSPGIPQPADTLAEDLDNRSPARGLLMGVALSAVLWAGMAAGVRAVL